MSSDQMPAPGKIKLIKFPPPGQEKTSNARGMPGGGDVEASIWLIHNSDQFFSPAGTSAVSIGRPDNLPSLLCYFLKPSRDRDPSITET